MRLQRDEARARGEDLAMLMVAIMDTRLPQELRQTMHRQLQPLRQHISRVQPIVERVRARMLQRTPVSQRLMEKVQGTPTGAAPDGLARSSLGSVIREIEAEGEEGAVQAERAAAADAAAEAPPRTPVRGAAAAAAVTAEASGGAAAQRERAGDASRSARGAEPAPISSASVAEAAERQQRQGAESADSHSAAAAVQATAGDELDEIVPSGARRRG